MRKFSTLLLTTVLIWLSSCDRMKPDTIAISKYPEMEQLFTGQVARLTGKQLEKSVWLENESESQTLTLDTATWKKELAFLLEVNPNQPEYVGAFEELSEGKKLILVLGEGERGVLKKLEYEKINGVSSIKATIHEDKDVYVHHREVALSFSGQVLSTYSIVGYQKIMLKDTVRFKIEGQIR